MTFIDWVGYNQNMFNHQSVGPVYCETPTFVAGDSYLGIEAFPLEPINVLTSLVPAIMGLWMLWYLYRRRQFLSPLLVVAAATLVVGVGSVLWHGTRTPLSLFLDWFPGVVAFAAFMFLWPIYIRNRWWGYGTLVTLFGLTTTLGIIAPTILPGYNPMISLFAAVAVVSAVLLYVTYKVNPSVIWWGVATYLLALSAAIARTVDLATCGWFPVGTHAWWHIALGSAALCGLLMLSRLHDARQQTQNPEPLMDAVNDADSR